MHRRVPHRHRGGAGRRADHAGPARLRREAARPDRRRVARPGRAGPRAASSARRRSRGATFSISNLGMFDVDEFSRDHQPARGRHPRRGRDRREAGGRRRPSSASAGACADAVVRPPRHGRRHGRALPAGPSSALLEEPLRCWSDRAMASQRSTLVVVGHRARAATSRRSARRSSGCRSPSSRTTAPGGVCLNWGCIPTKALLRNAEVVELFQRAEEFGITGRHFAADYAQAVQRTPPRGRPHGQGRRVPVPEEQDHARSRARRRSRRRASSRSRARTAAAETLEARGRSSSRTGSRAASRCRASRSTRSAYLLATARSATRACRLARGHRRRRRRHRVRRRLRGLRRAGHRAGGAAAHAARSRTRRSRRQSRGSSAGGGIDVRTGRQGRVGRAADAATARSTSTRRARPRRSRPTRC